MYEIRGLGSEPIQTIEFILDGGNGGTLKIVWMSDYLTWYVDISVNDKKINGIRLCNSTSLLKNYRYKGFDLACLFPKDPLSVSNYSLGKEVKLYVLLKNDFAPFEDSMMEKTRDYIEGLHNRVV